jgi:aldehyde:ferredoxin oxidoreductase
MLTGVIGCVAVRYEQQFHENPRPNFSAGFEANMLAGQMGLNHHELSYGIVPWLYRTKQMGIDTEKLLGMPIDVRSPEWWVKLINMIAYRKGFGDLLAEGTARTVERLGKAKYADPIYKGQDSIFDDLTQKIPVAALGGWGYLSRELLIELPHPIYIPGALNWMIDTRDPHHSKWPDVASPKFLEFVTSPDPYVSPLGPQLAYSSTIRGNLIDSLTTCWEFPMRQGLGWEYPFEVGTHTKWTDTESRLFSAVTGIKTTEEELDEAAKRITTLFRAIQIRNHDRTAQMEWNEFMPLLRKVDIDEDKFATTVGNFYDLWGWDRKTGWPTRATLESLDLKDVAEELQSLGKLP